MPRHVDEAERRDRVARAVWRVIVRDGLSGATVRAVAHESALSVGALRHYFTTQKQLQIYVFELLNSRAAERVDALGHVDDIRRRIEQVMWALLPLTPEQVDEERVRLAFLVAARTDPDLAELARDDRAQAVALTRSAVTALIGEDDPCVEARTRELTALLHGLAQHAALFPESMTAEDIRQTVTSWLDRNLTPEKGTP